MQGDVLMDAEDVDVASERCDSEEGTRGAACAVEDDVEYGSASHLRALGLDGSDGFSDGSGESDLLYLDGCASLGLCEPAPSPLLCAANSAVTIGGTCTAVPLR